MFRWVRRIGYGHAFSTVDHTQDHHYTWRDLEEEIRRLSPETEVEYAQNLNFVSIQSYSFDLKRKYGFFPMGRYDTAYLESKYHISRWKAAEKHAVLRFICDEPG